MDANNEIRLRLRFYKDVKENIDSLRQKFKNHAKMNSNDYLIKVKHNHIWLDITGPKKEYWSPHLHLELEPRDNNETHIRGLFGPDQALWTFFMFLHFIIAGVFIVFSAIAYSNYVLKMPTSMDLVVMLLMLIVWFLLYFIAKQIRYKGNQQMNELEALFLKIIES